ncbi:NADH-quinone oxidoreductase subunit N [Natronospira proteinivora]|uniref:NADH-quinone oxidoreductase subunit N n=1 Tax=Natronospira proteinivora TaxID=1807133 RepID=A0ABT1G6P4_9GAMM|nr:NADH-quinone oxidoreductase subunit NuoN [Natronospira proteinivora]MCP1726971.1 NADH-quinone oxidoreductase subunit N [Natronospira proteinivora]
MNFEMPQFTPVIPEMFVAGMACLVLLVDLFLSERNRFITHWLTMATLAGGALLTWRIMGDAATFTFGGMFIGDQLAHTLKFFLYGTLAVVLAYSRQYLMDRGMFKGEYYLLSLTSLLGMMIMVSAHNLLVVYLGLELLSLSLYTMVAFNRESSNSSEAAMKYFVLGAIASGVLLYGMSILYGVTGSLDLTDIAAYVEEAEISHIGLALALSFILVGLAFKIGAVPFHMWIPDVYQGAPTAVTLFVGAAPKIAAFALFMRLLADGFGGFHEAWQGMLIVLAVLSMAVGSFLAIAQTNIKRMLAYSTITHMGFILMGVMAGTTLGYQSAMFYTLIYVLMASGAFGMIILLSRKGHEAENIADFQGLNERSPWFAACMAMLMFGMAGVPPLAGFHAKLQVINAAIDAGWIWMAVAAVIFAIISAFYYLRVVKVMYFDQPEGEQPPVTESSLGFRALLSTNALAVLALGIFPGALMAVCAQAFM